MTELLCRAGDPQWQELRASGVTATDITVIAGLVTWDSPWALFWRKRGVLPAVEQTDRMRLGSWLEESLMLAWDEEHLDCESPRDGGLYRSANRPWQLATPDYLTDGLPLECKSWSTFDGWGPDGSGEVPAHIRAQVLWQMDTLGVDRGHVAVVFLPSGEFRSYTIAHSDGCNLLAQAPCQVCAEQVDLLDKGEEFYWRLQGELPPPDVDGMAATTEGLKARYASPGANLKAELPLAMLLGWETARGVAAASRRQLKADEEAARKYENKLREALADAVVGTVDGKPVIERKFTKRAGYTVAPTELDQLKPIKGE